MSNKNKKCLYNSNYVEHFLNSIFTVTVCICICAFASLVGISKGIMSSRIVCNICPIIARIKNYKSIIKKKKKKDDEIALLAKANLDSIKDLISRFVTHSYFDCNYFNLIDVLRKYDYMKEEINKREA